MEVIDFYKRVANFADTSLNTVLLVTIGLEVVADKMRSDKAPVCDDRKEFGQ